MDVEKTIKRYTKIYKKALGFANIENVDAESRDYQKRLGEMYASENFKKYSVYPSTNTTHVFGVIAMCLELKKHNLSDRQIIDTVNNGFSTRRNLFRKILRCIDRMPNAYEIAKKWNISDYEKRIRDGSLGYDYFRVSDGKIEYSISKCVYVEMFELYGIRGLCKIFCMTDTTSYENLPRHVKFVRHSDMSDGDCCHDEIIDKRH